MITYTNVARSVYILFKYIFDFFLDKMENNIVKEIILLWYFFLIFFVNKPVKANNLLGKMLIKTGEKIVK